MTEACSYLMAPNIYLWRSPCLLLCSSTQLKIMLPNGFEHYGWEPKPPTACRSLHGLVLSRPRPSPSVSPDLQSRSLLAFCSTFCEQSSSQRSFAKIHYSLHVEDHRTLCPPPLPLCALFLRAETVGSFSLCYICCLVRVCERHYQMIQHLLIVELHGWVPFVIVLLLRHKVSKNWKRLLWSTCDPRAWISVANMIGHTPPLWKVCWQDPMSSTGLTLVKKKSNFFKWRIRWLGAVLLIQSCTQTVV